MDLTSRLRAVVKSGPPKPARELTYEPDTGGYEAPMDLARVGALLGGQPAETPFGRCLVIDRRYEADRWHGGVRIGDCEVADFHALAILDPALAEMAGDSSLRAADRRSDRPFWSINESSTCREVNPFRERDESGFPIVSRQADGDGLPAFRRTIFIDLETTGLSGGAGTVAFLVGCGFFDLGAFQVRQFLLTSYASERALLSAVADFFAGADLIVTYNGKTFDVPVMETRWLFHRLQLPLESVAHFDMLHPARRLWRARHSAADADEGGCRLGTLERTLLNVTRVGDVGGFEIPGRFFKFLRSGDPRPLEPVLEHNRLDLVSLAAVMARAVEMAAGGHDACRDSAEALALGRIYERAAGVDRVRDRDQLFAHAERCYHRAAESRAAEVRGEALYRLGLRHRRERRFEEAAAIWREVLELTAPRGVRRLEGLAALRQFATEALAIHHEHRDHKLDSARELAVFALQEGDCRRPDGMRHRLARLDRKLAKKNDAQLFPN